MNIFNNEEIRELNLASFLGNHTLMFDIHYLFLLFWQLFWKIILHQCFTIDFFRIHDFRFAIGPSFNSQLTISDFCVDLTLKPIPLNEVLLLFGQPLGNRLIQTHLPAPTIINHPLPLNLIPLLILIIIQQFVPRRQRRLTRTVLVPLIGQTMALLFLHIT